MRTGTGSRQLSASDLAEVDRLLRRDPVESVLIGSRLAGDDRERTQTMRAIWGYPDDQPQSLCFFGANLIPLYADQAAADSFVTIALAKGRMCSSIVGERETVAYMWSELEESWGPARLIRWRQPVMATGTPSLITPDPEVRPATRDDFDVLFPASVRMYEEEIEASPLSGGGRPIYEHRLRSMIDRGRAFVRIVDGEVAFKAELGAVTPYAAQIQGVWVDPARRGQGLGAAGTAAVLNAALASGHQTVSLYVNDFNEPAIRAYRSVGFETVAEFMTVLF
ncbi:GNAT family N-acetyltransferase [Epidermidibacterium keratini]|uniref:GNAT family N-acetyltransferase n=1 Tax=Epidermidibacterium keratini TaxID=1891644 RepID=A0A7L4YSJ5_9ACTN|nr:DUF4081 domain-containing GNAT family N-acetyltransferase [Epidermidibacterium keratini]QHC01874.1 GNAT family N-acetyltransferase [Epidermidibacterium keratini]